MANQSNVFPAIIKAEYHPGNAFPAFMADADRASQNAAKKFESSFGQIQRAVEQSLSRATTAAGGLDLGVREANQAAEAAQRRADALREVARAARAAADAERNVPALNLQAKAASAAAVEARNYSRDLAQQALALDRLQVELDQAAASTQRFSQAQAGSAAMSGAGRQAYIGVGQQIADVAIQAQMGTNAFVILGQQGSQLAFQLSNAGGVAGRVATFFAGPWGAAVLGAASIAGLLATKLGDTAAAAENVKFATNAMSDAQSILGGVLDLTTGKINTQNSALIALAKAQILVAQVQAKTRAAEARRGVQDIQEREFRFSGGPGGGFSVNRRPADARDAISREVLAGTLDSKLAIERLDNLRQIGKLTDEQFASAAASVANLGLELQNVKVFGEAEKLLDGTGGRTLLKPARTKASRKTGSGADRAAAVAEFGRDASDKIASIRDRFGDSPTLIQRQASALRELADIQTDLEKRKPPKLDEYLAQLSEARKIVEGSLSKPFAEMLATAREQAAVDDLLIDGRELEAEILERTLALSTQKGGITQAEVEAIAEIVSQERLRTIEIDRQRQKQEEQLALVDRTQANLRDTVAELFNGKGFGAIGNLFERQFDTYVSGLTDQISESLFGDVFREQRLKVLGLDKVDEAGKEMASSIIATARELDVLKEAARGAANAVGATAANDNAAFPDGGFGQLGLAIAKAQSGITVAGRKPLTTSDLVKALGKEVLGEKLAGSIGNAVEQAMRGAAYGQAGAGLFSSLGVKTSKTGGQVGGALGEAAFKKLAPEVFKKLGDFAGPLGSIAGGIIGGLVGGLLKKTPKGNVTITSGNVSATGSKSLQGGLNNIGTGIQGSIARIAEQLNGDVGNYSLSVRQKGKSFYVGGQKFSDEAAASRAALLSAIQSGAVQGIKAGAQRLLSAGKDLDAQLQKAVKFQSVFDRLDAIKNPTGAAIDSLNREFGSLIKIFNEAGASAAELASLEELYGLERAKVIKEASDNLTGSLKSLIDDLTKGDSGLSLRDRLSNIRADFDPLAATIRSGGTVDYDKFSELARQLIEVQRDISGSQPEYFATFDEILALSRKALGDQQNVVTIGSNASSPFSGNAPPSNIATPIVGAIGQMSGDIVAGLAAVQAQIALLGRTGSGGSGSERSPVAIGGSNYF